MIEVLIIFLLFPLCLITIYGLVVTLEFYESRHRLDKEYIRILEDLIKLDLEIDKVDNQLEDIKLLLSKHYEQPDITKTN